MTKNTGRAYEEFVQSLYQAILASDILGFGSQKNINVEINKFLKDRNGIDRQFDIYWEYSLGGIVYQTVIECKDYESKISIEKIDSLIGKLNDFPNLRGLFATKSGYQSGADIKAKQHNIELLVIRQQNDEDWTDKNGEPLIKEININMVALLPAHIINLNLFLPAGSPSIEFSNLLNTEIIITDNDKEISYSAYDLQHKLHDEHENEYGEFTKEFKFNGLVTTPSTTAPIQGFRITYILSKPATQEINIDFSEKLIGVVEYLHQGRKAKIYEDFINILES